MTSSRLTTQYLRQLNAVATGAQAVVVKPNELESALARPSMKAYYQPSTPTHALAADLAFGIIMNHPFADGNKRTAFLAANEYLREKGCTPLVNAEPAVAAAHIQTLGNAHSRVAEGQMSADQLAAVYATVVSKPK